MNLALADPGGLGAAKFTVGDYDRDGRADIIALATDSTSTVYGMRGKADGTFADKGALWSTSAADLSDAQPLALNIDSDGMADVALVFFSSRRRHTRLTCDWSSDVCSSD